MTPGPPAVSPADPPPRVPWFYRIIYWAYARSLTFNEFFRRRLRPAGICLMLLLGLSAVLGAGTRLAGGPQLFAITLALLMVAVGWAWLRRGRAVATRVLPRYATAGELVNYQVEVRNAGRWPLRDAWLAEMRPDARPSLATFYHSREPGEEHRNFFDRVFAAYRWQWLLDMRRAFEGGKAIAPLRLEPGKSACVGVSLRPLRRGRVVLGDLRILLADPLGLFQRCRKVSAAVDTLTVLPRRYRLPPLVLDGSARFQLGGEVLSNALGQSGEFVGLRDYRAGDSLRQIHWRSWARLGRPIVKELEDTFLPRYGLALDTFPAAGDEALFEEAVSLAASFAATLETHDSLLDLMFIHGEAHQFTAGRGAAKAEKMLEVLAAVESAPREDFSSLWQLVLRHRDDLSACLCILTGWTRERAELVGRIARTGVDLVVFVICTDAKACTLLLEADPPPVRVHLLRAGRMQVDVLALPERL